VSLYDVFFHSDFLEIVPAKGIQRERILRFLRDLAAKPQSSGDFTDRDQSQRTLQIKVIGNFSLTWWVDDAARAIMIVAIGSADH
jgi:hypothetical protein